MYIHVFFKIDAVVSFENTDISKSESTGHVELTVLLSQSVPFEANLTLHAKDDTAKSKLYSASN